MNDKQQQNRLRAEQKFMHSLDELETVLQPKDTGTKQPHPSANSLSPTAEGVASKPDSRNCEANFHQMLDDAVQDIEQFMSGEQKDPED